MIIRQETPRDHRAIHDLTQAAFAPMPFGEPSDALLPENLRELGDLLLSLVAEENDIIGHVAFSPANLPCDGRWAALGPISVTYSRQKQGIGSKLAKTGLGWLSEQGFDGCVLIGNSRVYGPMGFQSGGITYRDLDPKLVQWQTISGAKPSGEVLFAPALEA